MGDGSCVIYLLVTIVFIVVFIFVVAFYRHAQPLFDLSFQFYKTLNNKMHASVMKYYASVNKRKFVKFWISSWSLSNSWVCLLSPALVIFGHQFNCHTNYRKKKGESVAIAIVYVLSDFFKMGQKNSTENIKARSKFEIMRLNAIAVCT